MGLARLLQLLEELRTLIRHQADAHQAAMTEHARLRAVIEDTATRLEGMLAGQRASRAELQALIEALRAAIAPPPPRMMTRSEPATSAERDTCNT